MKQCFLFLLLVIFNTFLFSEDDVIQLQNKKSRTRPQAPGFPDQRDFVNGHNGEEILPNGLYIGELGDFYVNNTDSKKIISITDSFCSSLKDKKAPVSVDEDYMFIFNSVYEDILLKDSDIVDWYIGVPRIFLKSGEVSVELHLKDSVITGIIYFEKSELWIINDVQLEIKEKRVFEPSSPYNLF